MLHIITDHPLICTYLSVCEVVLAEFLPDQPVLSEDPQFWTDLAQADQIPPIRQTLHDVQFQANRQVGQSHACRCGLEGTTTVLRTKSSLMHLNDNLNSIPGPVLWADAHPVDLDVVELLVPLQDVLHAVHPRVDIPHQHRLAHVLNKTTKLEVERLQQLLDGSYVLLVIKYWGRKLEVAHNHKCVRERLV